MNRNKQSYAVRPLSKPFVRTLKANLRPEVELFLCCARTSIDTPTAERIQILLQQDIDWTYLIRSAANHGVIQLLYRNLNATCPDAVPKASLDQLRGFFYTNARHNLLLAGELLKLLNLFEVHGIPAIPFKGPTLATSVYGGLAFRQFRDLDILVREQDLLKVHDLLVSQKYQPVPDRQLKWEALFVHEESGVNVDLHHRIVPQYFPSLLRFEHLWQCLESVSLAGSTVVNLSSEDLLIVLSVQVAKNCRDEEQDWLAKICDIAQLIRDQVLDWQQVLQRAHMLNSERPVFLGLVLASDLLGVTLPEDVVQRIQLEPVIELYAAQVRQQLFSEVDSPHDGVFESFLRRSMMDRSPCRVSRGGYLWYFLRLAVTPNEIDRKFLPLPTPLSLLYYLVRPTRLASKYGLMILKRLLGPANPHAI